MTADGFHFTFDLLHLLYVLFTHFEVIEKDIFAKLQWQWQVGWRWLVWSNEFNNKVLSLSYKEFQFYSMWKLFYGGPISVVNIETRQIWTHFLQSLTAVKYENYTSRNFPVLHFLSLWYSFIIFIQFKQIMQKMRKIGCWGNEECSVLQESRFFSSSNWAYHCCRTTYKMNMFCMCALLYLQNTYWSSSWILLDEIPTHRKWN